MKVTNERRADPRAPLTADAVVFVGDKRLQARTIDVSAGGVAVELDAPPPSPFVRVNFRLSPEQAWVDADAMIARTAAWGRSQLVALRFITLDATTKARISSFVEAIAMRKARDRQAKMLSQRFAGGRNTPTANKFAAVRAVTHSRPSTDKFAAGTPDAPRSRASTDKFAALPPDAAPAPARKSRPRVAPARPSATDRDLRSLYAAAVREVTAPPDGKKKRKRK